MVAEHSHDPNHEIDAAYMVNHVVASLGVLNVKLHQYHWFVQGPHFETLHAKFEELYDEVNANFDEFAERLISIGVQPYSTLEEFLEHSFIKEETYNNKLSAEQMVEKTVDDYRTMRDVVSRAVTLAGDEGDTATEDLMIGFNSSIDKTLWMLQAFLGKDATEGE